MNVSRIDIRKVAAATAVLVLTGTAGVPAYAQATTLIGSVNASRQVAPTPLQSRTPRFDSSASAGSASAAVSTAAPTRTIVKTVVVDHTDRRTYFQKHPKVKSAVIGAGVGAGAGAVTGLISHRGIFRGAAIGAGTGAGVGLIRSSQTLKRHPIIRDVATGTAAGFGLGAAASRHGRTMGKSAAVGAAVGLGYNLLKRLK